MPVLYPILSPLINRHKTSDALSGVSLSTPRAGAQAVGSPRPQTLNSWLNYRWKKAAAIQWSAGRMTVVRPVRAAQDQISEKVVESIKNVEEACSDDPASGECVAAWDEVEELSAAASDARDKIKDSDPLEEFCKDNPETEECRTYGD